MRVDCVNALQNSSCALSLIALYASFFNAVVDRLTVDVDTNVSWKCSLTMDCMVMRNTRVQIMTDHAVKMEESVVVGKAEEHIDEEGDDYWVVLTDICIICHDYVGNIVTEGYDKKLLTMFNCIYIL